MNKTFQKVSTWFGVASMIIFFAGMLVADIFPPFSPTLTGPEVQAFVQEHAFGLRLGGLLMLISGAFSAPFISIIFLQIRRMEGTRPIGAYGQLAAGIVNILFFMLPGIAFVILGFRPERAVDSLYALSDLAWIATLLPWTANSMEALCCGIAIIGNPQATNVYPRWVGFINIWISICMITSSVIPFFKTGPFAWNGLVGWWIPATMFGLWISVMFVMTLKAIDSDDGK